MKVDRSTNQAAGMAQASTSDSKKAVEGIGQSFLNTLRYSEEKSNNELIRDMANKIFEQGDKLGSKVDIRELKLYKKMISDFLGQAVGGAFKFSKESFLRRGRYKIYATVKKINQELDELTKEVLAVEHDHIGILKKIEDIRGLILDLLL